MDVYIVDWVVMGVGECLWDWWKIGDCVLLGMDVLLCNGVVVIEVDVMEW